MLVDKLIIKNPQTRQMNIEHNETHHFISELNQEIRGAAKNISQINHNAQEYMKDVQDED